MVFRMAISVLAVLAPMLSFADTSQALANNTLDGCLASSNCTIERDHLSTQMTTLPISQGYAVAQPWFANRVISKPDLLYLAQSEPEQSNAVANSGQPRSVSCDDIDIPFFSLNSKRAVEKFIEHEILESYRKNGFVDWECLVDKFQSAEENTSVLVYNKVPSLDGADVYRFTVDKTGGFVGFFRGLFSVPGGSNGVYTAIVNHAVDGKVSVIQRGGIPKWLKLE